MAETFLILLAAGIMLAVALSDPRQVTLQWLRLCGILALSMLALSVFFVLRRAVPVSHRTAVWCGYGAAAGATLGQLALVQTARRVGQRVAATVAVVAGVGVGVLLLPNATAAGALAASGIAGMTGVCLMDMLLGHAYLTASRMGISPFLRLNRALAIVVAMRVLSSVVVAPVMQARHPSYLFWGKYGLYVFTRWLVGLGLAGVFVYMAHDCIRRRSTQSATGILYVAGVVVFIGELLALYLVMETGLPF